MSTTTSTAPVRSTRPTVPFWAQVLLGLVVGVVLGFVARQFSVGWLSELLTQVGAIELIDRMPAAARAQFDSQDRMAADEIQESLAEIEGGVEVQGEPSDRSETEVDFDLATADPETDQYVVAVA